MVDVLNSMSTHEGLYLYLPPSKELEGFYQAKING